MSARYCGILREGEKELPTPPPHQDRKGRLPKSEGGNYSMHLSRARTRFCALQSAVRCRSPKIAASATFEWRKSGRKSGTFRNITHAHAWCKKSSYLRSMSCQGYNSLAAIHGDAVDMLDHSKLNHSQSRSTRIDCPFRVGM